MEPYGAPTPARLSGAKQEFIDRLVDDGVDLQWATDYVAARGADYWNQYLSLPENLQSGEWANAVLDFRQDVAPDARVDGGGDVATSPFDPVRVVPQTVTEAEEEAQKVEEKEQDDALLAAVKSGDEEAIQMAYLAKFGQTGEGLPGYDDALLKMGKLDYGGSLTPDAMQELLAGMRESWGKYGEGDPPTTSAEAVTAFNALPLGAKYSVFGSIWETEQAQWRSFDVPGVGEVQVLNSEEAEMSTVLRDLSPAMIDDAAVAAAIHEVDWRLVLLASEANESLYVDYAVDPGSGGPGQEGAGFTRPSSRRRLPLDILAKAIAEGTEKYGDEVTGYIYAVDKDLAQAVYDNPYALSGGQTERLEEIMDRFTPQNQQYLPGDSTVISWLRDDVAKANETRRPVDAPAEADVRSGLRSLWQSWFREDPNDSDLDQFTSFFANQQVEYANRRDTGFNPLKDTPGGLDPSKAPSVQVSAGEYLRGTAEYDTLFGNRPSGMSEEGYVQAMSTQAQSLLGSAQGQLASDAVRAGMRAGSTQAVAQQAIASGSAYESSTFMGRLARGANVFREML